MALPPSGRQVELVSGAHRAVVVEIGGGLRSYEVAGRPVLDGYAEGAMATGGRGQLLMPWPNRIDAGRYEHAGAAYQLPISEVSHGNAIHGLARWAAWSVTSVAADRVQAAFALRPQPGYPWQLALAASYALGAGGLQVTQSVTNVDSVPVPVGMGAHPYLFAGDPLVDAATLTVRAATRLVLDERNLPVGTEPVGESRFDFRDGRRIGAQVVDTAYTDLSRVDGVYRTEMLAPDGRSFRLWQDETWPYVQVFTGDTLAPAERRRGLAVEPMTCAANAFNSGDGLVVLEPGATLSGVWGIEVSG